jgi:O-antigen/teichoic acid export membrane protein
MLKLGCALASAVAMALVPVIQGASQQVCELTWMFSVAMVFWAILNFLFSVFRGIEQIRHEGVISLITNSVLFAAVGCLALLHAPLLFLAFGFAAVRLLGVIVGQIRLSHLGIRLGIVWDPAWLAGAWRGIATFGMFSIFGNLFFIQDTVLLSWWRGDADVGIYQAGFRLIVVALVLVDVAISALLPRLSRLHREGNAQWFELASMASKGMLFVGLAMSAVLVAYADGIVRLLYGINEFSDTIRVVQILGLVVLVRYAGEVPAMLLTAADRQHIRLALVVGATVVNLIANTFAIPAFGPVGAAVVSLGTNLVLGVGYVIAGRSLTRHRWWGIDRLAPVVGAAALVGAAVALNLPMWIGMATLPAGILALCVAWGMSPAERLRIFQLRAW